MLTTCIIISIILVIVTKRKLEKNHESIQNCWSKCLDLMSEKYAVVELLAGLLKLTSVDYFDPCDRLLKQKDNVLNDKLKSRKIELDMKFDRELEEVIKMASADPAIKDNADFKEMRKDLTNLIKQIEDTGEKLAESINAYNSVFDNKITAFIATKSGHSVCSLDRY